MAVSIQVTGTGSGNMNFFELVAGVVGNLFVAGIVVGFLIIGVLPGDGRRDMDGGDCREAPPPRDDEQPPSRWPEA
jgi:hypothetical protein